MQLIGLEGRARTGKDTCADYLVEKHGFIKYSFAGPLKKMLWSGLGLAPGDYVDTDTKEAVIPWLGVSYRQAAQTLGTEWGRNCINQNLWVLLAQNFVARQLAINSFESTPMVTGVVFSDVRFNNEAEWLRSAGGRIFHLARKDAAMVRDHPSEHGVAARNEDALILNFGTKEQLYATLDAALRGHQ